MVDALDERRIAVVLTTDYDEDAIPSKHAGLTRLQKPIEARAVARRLSRVLAACKTPEFL